MEKGKKRKAAFFYAGVVKYCTSEGKDIGQDAEPGGYNAYQMCENSEHCSRHLCNRQNPENSYFKQASKK